MDRVASYVKRLCINSLTLSAQGAVASLALVKTLFQRHIKMLGYLDADAGLGMGQYAPYLDDPDLCNPFSASLWEISSLALTHFHPAVRDMAKFILSMERNANAPVKNPSYDASLFLDQHPSQLYSKYDELHRKGFSFAPSLPRLNSQEFHVKAGHILKNLVETDEAIQERLLTCRDH